MTPEQERIEAEVQKKVYENALPLVDAPPSRPVIEEPAVDKDEGKQPAPKKTTKKTTK